LKVIVLVSLLLALLALVFPILTALAAPVAADAPVSSAPELYYSASQTPSPAVSPSSAPSSSSAPSVPAASSDASVSLKVLDGGEVKSMSLADYLPGAVAAEMPASFEPQALRAQAAAIRTYVLYRQRVSPSGSHPQADVCTDSACCLAWSSEDALREKWGSDYAAYSEKIRSAVSDTDGVWIAWSGEPVLAAFHSSSAGKTEDSSAVWGSSLPYLVSVSTPETAQEVPNYVAGVTVSADDFSSAIRTAFPGADLSGGPASWIGASVYDAAGRLSSVSIGGASVSGTALRSLFSLRSAAIAIAAADGAVTLTCTGYGHGVGMSQYGANVLASQGRTWKEILAWYYPGTELRSGTGGAVS